MIKYHWLWALSNLYLISGRATEQFYYQTGIPNPHTRFMGSTPMRCDVIFVYFTLDYNQTTIPVLSRLKDVTTKPRSQFSPPLYLIDLSLSTGKSTMSHVNPWKCLLRQETSLYPLLSTAPVHTQTRGQTVSNAHHSISQLCYGKISRVIGFFTGRDRF